MRSVSTAIAGAGLLLLTACGGGAEEAATENNTVETLDVGSEDVLAPTDNGLDADIDANLGADTNALGTDVNALDANLSVDANASVNSQ